MEAGNKTFVLLWAFLFSLGEVGLFRCLLILFLSERSVRFGSTIYTCY